MAVAACQLRLVIEPGRAVALAAVLAGKAGAVSERSVVVLSGGNVDLRVFAGIIRAQAADTTL